MELSDCEITDGTFWFSESFHQYFHKESNTLVKIKQKNCQGSLMETRPLLQQNWTVCSQTSFPVLGFLYISHRSTPTLVHQSSLILILIYGLKTEKKQKTKKQNAFLSSALSTADTFKHSSKQIFTAQILNVKYF